MSKNKKKIKKLTDEQYNQYIAGLKNNTAALFSADGGMLVPDELKKPEQGENKDN